LSARGAALQASLVAEFDIEGIEQSTHPAVTVAPHLKNDIGIVFVDKDGKEEFQTVLAAQTAIPARRSAEFLAPFEGGDIVVKFVEGVRVIHKTVPEKTSQTNGEKGGDDGDSDLDLSEDEDKEIKSKHMKVESVLAEALLKGVEKNKKVEVTINAGADGSLNVTARIVGTQQGVRGTISAS
jgi:hypothetical protein